MASRAQTMTENDDAQFLEDLRYGQALLNEGRSRLHRSIPGALVAEVLRHIENSMAGTSQYELERMLLGSDHSGAEWRAYVAHRHRCVTEKRLWRTWYGRHGKKDTIPPGPAEDVFGIQTPPRLSPMEKGGFAAMEKLELRTAIRRFGKTIVRCQRPNGGHNPTSNGMFNTAAEGEIAAGAASRERSTDILSAVGDKGRLRSRTGSTRG